MASSSSRAPNEKKRRQRNEEDHEDPGSHQKKKKDPGPPKRKRKPMSARRYRKLLDRRAMAESSERTNARGEGAEADCHQEMLELREPTPNDVNLSSYHKKQFSSQCSVCSKLQREDDYSAAVFCSCNSIAGEVLNTSSESLGGVKTKDNTCSADGDPAFTQLKDLDAIRRDGDRTVCVTCKHPGFLLRCCGRGCWAGYHLACLDPPLSDIPPGLWLCFCCLRKKMELGVYSVSEGIESVLGFKEELQKEKHYFVKYKGLAHFYNVWIPESQLLCEDPTLLAKFNKKQQKEQVNRWKHKWMEPHRLLQKRFLMRPVQDHECSCGHGDDFEYCYHEWFVKWKGLGYEHATWEFENSPFLCSVEGKALINTYERRREEAKKASGHSGVDKIVCPKDLFDKLPSLPDGCTAELDNDHLDSISRILSFWDKKRNAVLIDDKECIAKSILFVINLLSSMCRPFLIISATSSLSVWEDEFHRLAPSVNVVVYNGNEHVRNMIRTLELYDEGGCIMLEVLLACPTVIVEDLDALDCIGWQAIIIDDCQKTGISKHLEKFSVIPSEFRLLLWNNPLKDNVVDYLKLLSLLDPRVQENTVKAWKLDSTKSDDALSISKERLAPYVVYEGKQNISAFVEYWVPVQLSEVQIKEYCSILASNSHLLRLRPRDDCVESLLDVLFAIQKCCDHPYLVNESLRQSLIETHPVVEYLNVDVNASGKLHLLDKILQEVKNHGLRVIILFQSSVGSERNRMGDYLCDVLCQRFGDGCYAYVDSRMDKSKTQSILQSFNNKGKEKFVIVIETRACRPRIKLSSVDAVVIYDSDWNPLNDLKALRKITIFSQVQEVKVFRLYSPYTVEEKVLELAKKDGGLEVDIQNTSTRLRHSLLSWGAAHLFSRLKELPQVGSVDACPKLFRDNSLLRDMLYLLTQLPESIATCDRNCSDIVKAHLNGAAYSSNIHLYGEKGDLLSLDGDPTLFWSKLLETHSPKFLPRIRRGAQRPDRFVKRSESETYGLKKVIDTEVVSQENHLQCKGQEDERSGETAVPMQTTLSNNEPDPNSSSATSGADGIHVKKPGTSKCQPSSTAMMTDVTHSLQVPENLVRVSNDTISETSTPASSKVQEMDEESRFPLHKKDVPKGFLQGGNANVAASDLKKERNIGVVSQETHLQRKGQEDECSGETAVPVQTTWSNSEPEPNSSSATSIANGIDVKKPGASKCLPSSTAMMTDVTHSLQVPENLVHVSNDTIAGTSTLASSKVQEMDEESQFPLHKTSDQTYPKLAENKSYLPTNCLSEAFACAVTSDALPSDHVELEEGEIREDDNIQTCSGQQIIKEILLLKEEILKKRINLIDEACSARLEKLLLLQEQEVTEFKNQVNQEEEKLNSLDLKLISATYNDLEVSDVMRKLKQELSNHVKCQRKKLLVMQVEARIKEKEIKKQWSEKAKMGTLVNSFDSLPLSATGFQLENFKFGVQVGTHGSLGNAFSSYGSSSDATSRSVGCIEPSRPTTVLGVVPNEGTLPFLSENEMSICNSTCPIAVESAKQNRTTFDISEANTSGGSSDEILRTKSPYTLRNIHSSTEVTSRFPAIATEKKGKKIFTEVASSVCQSKGVNEVEFVGPTSGFSSISPLEEFEKIQTEKGSAARQSRSVDVVKFVEATASSQETEQILMEEQSPACQSKGLNVVESNEPSRSSPCIPKTILFGGVGHKSPETEVLISPCQSMNATSENVDKKDIVTGTSAERHGDAQLDDACLTSSQEKPINISSLCHTSNHAGYANSGLHNQEHLAISRTELASSVSPDNMIPISESVGSELMQVERCNHIPEASEPAMQLSSSSTGLTSVMPHYEREHVDIGSVQVPWNKPDCSSQLNAVLPPASTVATSTGIGQVNNSLSQSFTLSVPPIFNVPPRNTSCYHLRGPTIQPELATSAPRQSMPQHEPYSNPLHNEIIRLHNKELELSQLLEEKKRKLELECGKELEKVRKKYASLIQDNEAEFTKRINGIKASRSLIGMNKELAEQFRKCFVQNKKGTTTVSQGSERSNSMQQLLHLPRPVSASPLRLPPLSFGGSQGQRICQGQFSPGPVLASPHSFGVSTPLMPLSFGVFTPLMPTPLNPPFDSPLSLPCVSPSLASVPLLQPTPNGAAAFSKGLNRPPAGSGLNYQAGIDHLRPAPHIRPIRSQPNTQQNGKLRNPQ